MNSSIKLTNVDRVIQVAAILTNQGKTSVRVPELVVAVWEQFPDEFGLEGKTDTHPDSSKVIVTLLGKCGAIQKGFFRRDDQRRLVMTADGLMRAKEIEVPTPVKALTQQQQHFLANVLNSSAFKKITADLDGRSVSRREDVTKDDVRDFFRISEFGSTVDAAIASFDSALDKIDVVLDDAKQAKIGEQIITGATVRLIRNTGNLLQTVFVKYLDKLRHPV